MKFLSLVRSSETQGAPPQAMMDAMGELVGTALADGSVVSTGGLARTSSGVRMRISAGEIRTTDGPFTEAKEVVGGYAILEAPDRESALEAVRRFLAVHAEHWPEWEGECELREIEFLAP